MLLSFAICYLSDPMICPDFYPHVHGTAAVCQFVIHAVLSILSKGVYKLPSVSESPLEVCIPSRRVVTLVYGSVTFEFWWSSSSITTKTGGWCGYHVPEPTCLGKMSKPLQPSRHRFWKDRLGNTGDLSCLEHATEPSPPRSADGSSAGDIPPSGFPAAGLRKAPPDCSFYPRAGGALTTSRPPLSLPLNTSCHFSLPGTGASCTSGSSSHPVLSLSLCQRPAVSARVVTHSAVVVQ